MIPRIAFFNKFFERWPSDEELGPAQLPPLFGPRHAADAEVVVYHLPTLSAEFFRRHVKPEGQLWVAWCLESPVTCTAFSDPELRQRFDLTISHERAADVWTPYFGLQTAEMMMRPPISLEGREQVAVVHLQSNPYDACDRNRYVFDLMRKIRVDSCGKIYRTCHRNVGPGWPGRIELMRGYKFTLAMENSIAPDYVTDKFFDPLMVGSVPVYRGIEDVQELAPHPESYVDAADFESPAHLAEHLKELDQDDAAYSRLHAWRQEGFSPTFQGYLERIREPTFVRLLSAVRQRLSTQ